jgi:hypothetical protein
LTNVYSGLALDDPNGGGSGTGTDQQVYTNANQQWQITSKGGGYYEIANAATGLALSGPTANAQLVVQPYSGAANQLWSFVPNGSSYNVTNEATGQALNDFGVSSSPGNAIGQWTSAADKSTNQLWTLSDAPVFTPVFSLVGGSYPGQQSVTISDSVSGSTIYYTTDGTTPTTSSTKYTAALSIASTETIKAIAVKSGDANSAVASATYTITAPVAPGSLSAPGSSGQVALKWTVSAGAVSYSVYRGTSSNKESTTAIATGISGSSYTNTGLSNSTTYYFTVKAVNSIGTSAASNEASAKP